MCEGSKAFDDLHQLIDKLADCGLDSNTTQSLQTKLKEAKSYIKTDFKVSSFVIIIIF